MENKPVFPKTGSDRDPLFHTDFRYPRAQKKIIWNGKVGRGRDAESARRLEDLGIVIRILLEIVSNFVQQTPHNLKISERNSLGSAGGIPPNPLPSAAPVRLWRRSNHFGLDDFKFFVPLLAELWASPSLVANSFLYNVCAYMTFSP
jgi:hypothetical protein